MTERRKQVPAPGFLVLRVLVLFAWALGCAGCELAGTHDVELIYRTAPEPAPSAGVARRTQEDADDELRDAIDRRLGVAHVSADIDVDPSRDVHVTVSADDADTVEEVLRWQGGLELYRLSPDAPPPPLRRGVIEVHDAGGAYLVGPPGNVLEAIRAATADGDRVYLAEWLPEGMSRTRTLVAPALADLAEGVASVQAVDAGHSLAIRFTPAAKDALEKAIDAAEGAPLVLGRARTALLVQPLTRDAIDPLVVSFGRDLYSYARAHRTKLYLGTPPLPVLARSEVAPLPKNVRLALACFFLPMVLSFSWLFFVRQFDRARPEPMWLVLATFVLGGLSAFLAGLSEILLQSLSPYLSPELMTLGGQLRALPIALAVFTLVVGVSEEGAKLLGAWSLAFHRREFDEPIDGIVYGAASSLGFAAVENIKYFASGRVAASLVAARTFTSVPAHLFFGAIWGYALGQKLISKKKRVWPWFLLAALAHGAFDTLLSIDGLALAAMALNFAMAALFVILLRKSLRHGAMTPEMAAVPTSSRALFSVGTPFMFAVYAVGMHVTAFCLLIFGGWVQHVHQRIGFGFVGFASGAILLLGFSAWGLTTAMPLDVVVDAYGVTFAGASRAWARIRGFDRRVRIGSVGVRAELWLRSPDGDIRLGPGDPGVVDRLASALEAGLSSRPPPVGLD